MPHRTRVALPRDYTAAHRTRQARIAYKAHDGHKAGDGMTKSLPLIERVQSPSKDGMTLEEFARAHVDELTRPLLTHIHALTRQLEAQIAFLEQLSA